MTEKTVIIAGRFDQMDYRQIRFIHEASKYGSVHAILFDDALVEKTAGASCKFPLTERVYFVENVRYVKNAHIISSFDQLEDIKELTGIAVDVWVDLKSDKMPLKQTAQRQGIEYCPIEPTKLDRYPEHKYNEEKSLRKKVIVTGCFDWLHTGHVRFFEEANEYGDLYVALGNDKNLEQLKGAGHPMFCQDLRKYVAGSIRFVRQAMISSGYGWLDAEPEIERIRPEIYITNEDGDKQVKKDYCRAKGIEYIVLKREPKAGLMRRTSTNLRGF